VITFGDVWHMCKEFDIQELISKQEVQQLLRLVNKQFFERQENQQGRKTD